MLVCAGLGVAALWLLFRDEALKPVIDLMPRQPKIAWDDNNGWKRLNDFAVALPALKSIRQRQLSDFMNETGPGQIQNPKKTRGF